MRAIAILLVVFSHTLWITPNASGLIADLLSLAGVIGVEIFFVLSGFLIGKLMYNFFIKKDFSFKDVTHFWVRRWFRTLPNYYLILGINISIAFYLGTKLPDNLWSYFFFFQNFGSQMPRFFSESWSLPIEEFAYILGPLLLYTFGYLKYKVRNAILFKNITLAIIIFFFITKIIYNWIISDSDMNFWNVNVKAITIYRVDAIYYGVLAAFLSMTKPNLWKNYKVVCFIIGAFVFLGLNVIIPTKKLFIETHPFFWNVLYLPINSIAIAFTIPLLSQIKSAPKLILKPITYISLISYSMYLLHYSVILQLMKYFIPSESIARFDQIIYVITYLAITILSSYILYLIFEKPMTDLRDKSFIKNRFIKN